MRGADVMYAERFGVSDAAKERGVKAIGNVIDTSADYPGTILASALWHMEPTIDRAINAVIDGTLHGRTTTAPTASWPMAAARFVVDEALVRRGDRRRGQGQGDRRSRTALFRVNVNDAEPKSTM